jgi:hypothetical protein
MPTKTTVKNARRDAREGKKPSTQAGEFIRAEMHRLEEGSATVRSRRQAVAIGLSEARRAGVKVAAPKKGAKKAARTRAK